VLPGVVRHRFIIFGLFTTTNLCPWHKILATPLFTLYAFWRRSVLYSVLSVCLSVCGGWAVGGWCSLPQ